MLHHIMKLDPASVAYRAGAKAARQDRPLPPHAPVMWRRGYMDERARTAYWQPEDRVNLA